MVKLTVEEFEALIKKIKELLAANEALNKQIDAYNLETKELLEKNK